MTRVVGSRRARRSGNARTVTRATRRAGHGDRTWGEGAHQRAASTSAEVDANPDGSSHGSCMQLLRADSEMMGAASWRRALVESEEDENNDGQVDVQDVE